MSFNSIVADALRTARNTFGVFVIYRRSGDYTRIMAQVGKSDFQTTEVKAVLIEDRTRDYMVSACELRLNGQSIEPERGDEIDEQIGNQLFTYQVMRTDGGQPWRFSDTGQTQMRIHTKLKSVVSI